MALVGTPPRPVTWMRSSVPASSGSDRVGPAIDLAEVTFVDSAADALVTRGQTERVLRDLDSFQITGSKDPALTTAARLDHAQLLSQVPEPAAALVLATFCMRGMVALHVTVIASNVAFIAYGVSAGIDPLPSPKIDRTAASPVSAREAR